MDKIMFKVSSIVIQNSKLYSFYVCVCVSVTQLCPTLCNLGTVACQYGVLSRVPCAIKRVCIS